MSNPMLFIDCCSEGGLYLDLNESTTNKGLTKFKGKFQEAETINKNKRLYPKKVLYENVERLNEVVKSRGLVGELDHPTDSIIHFEKASHVITRLWWENNVLLGEGEILDTPHGKILKALINNNVRVGVSSRGVGNGSTDENGILVIGENYKLITFDVVADPSTPEAFQKKIVKNNNENHIISQNSFENVIKNENRSITKIDKKVLVACLHGLIESQSQSLKERLI
jgi:hypothetical protein